MRRSCGEDGVSYLVIATKPNDSVSLNQRCAKRGLFVLDGPLECSEGTFWTLKSLFPFSSTWSEVSSYRTRSFSVGSCSESGPPGKTKNWTLNSFVRFGQVGATGFDTVAAT